MQKSSISKLSRKELEQLCETLYENINSLSNDLEVRDRHIKHLTANARKWSKRYYSDVESKSKTKPSQEHYELEKSLMQSVAEKEQMQELVARVNESNVELMKKLQLLQSKMKISELLNARLKERLEQDGVKTTQASPLVDSPLVDSSIDSSSAPIEGEEFILEFSQEMQQTLAKYAA